MRDTATMGQRSLAQTLALVFGIAFLAAGILGFIPGITTNYGDMKFAGNDSRAELLGIFQVSILHNIVHLLFGIAGLALARTWDGARDVPARGGVIYIVLFVYGLLVSSTSDANFVPINNADDWLHLLLGVGLLGFVVDQRPGAQHGRQHRLTFSPRRWGRPCVRPRLSRLRVDAAARLREAPALPSGLEGNCLGQDRERRLGWSRGARDRARTARRGARARPRPARPPADARAAPPARAGSRARRRRKPVTATPRRARACRASRRG